MGAKQSAEVTEALRLIDQEGKTPAEAARLAKCTKGRLSQILKERREKGDKKNAAKPA